MTSIFYLFIALPIIFLGLIHFVFQANLADINRQQLKMNCPLPVNAGVAVLTPLQNPPNVNYTITYDNNTSDYNVTLFRCGETSPSSVSTIVYTADTGNQWFDITNRASGYMFYISEALSTLGQRIVAFGTLIWLNLSAPTVITGLAWFAYLEVILFSFVGLGIFMVVRG